MQALPALPETDTAIITASASAWKFIGPPCVAAGIIIAVVRQGMGTDAGVAFLYEDRFPSPVRVPIACGRFYRPLWNLLMVGWHRCPMGGLGIAMNWADARQ